ncbi:hypothetical protein BCR32DRAFT_280883 [Anaeromyces robustus]|uniref:Uncharacterized protein n=1 Tax=Anaeromyces robustus TaxID=1754192 RepID=A0A1Y1X3Z7_9FUNG|nr:hypothetical protein BCR32DRAFT_280883 [Anaeromyces robustus]|eukprot:ORX80034.1 hypothetical protein BCR32DRAFT_280883 [Anaeromyces robustus]
MSENEKKTNPVLEEYLRKRRNPNQKPLIEIADEKERLLKLKEQKENEVDEVAENIEEEPPYFLQSIIFTIPFSLLYAWLYYLVYFQYNMLDELEYKEIITSTLTIMPAFLMICYVVRRYKKYILLHIILGLIGAASAVYAIHIIFIDERFGKMLNTPGLIVLCIYCVMEANIVIAVLILIPPIIYYFNDGFRTKLSSLE